MKKFAIAAGLAMMIGVTGAQADGENPGFALSPSGAPVKTNSGDCWITPNSTLREAVAGCGPEVAAPAMMPKVVSVADMKTFALYFDFDKTVVGSVANIVDHIGSLSFLKSVNLVGHADPIGDESYNFGLSQRRAEAVATELSASGVDSGKISVSAMGETAPVANCTGTGAQLIACLRPDRRVDVEVVGEVKKEQM